MRAVGLILLVALAGGCKKDEPASTRPEPISAAERKRGEDACAAYVARLCACAADKPDLAERCTLHGGRVETIALALEIADDPGVTAADVFNAQRSIRQVIANCIEDAAQLDSAGCP